MNMHRIAIKETKDGHRIFVDDSPVGPMLKADTATLVLRWLHGAWIELRACILEPEAVDEIDHDAEPPDVIFQDNDSANGETFSDSTRILPEESRAFIVERFKEFGITTEDLEAVTCQKAQDWTEVSNNYLAESYTMLKAKLITVAGFRQQIMKERE